MKVLVCGGRDYNDKDRLYEILDTLSKEHKIDIVIVGGARGADKLAENWAWNTCIHCAVVMAMWDMFGKSAGYKRNAAMLALQPDLVVAFPGGKGTAMMVDLATKAGVPVQVVDKR